MAIFKIFNISMELWGCLITMLLAFFIYHERKPSTPRSRFFTYICVCQSLLLLSDALAYLCEGNPSYINRGIVITANFTLYILGYVLMALFTMYLMAYIERNGEAEPISRMPLRIVLILSTLGILLTTVSQFNHMYYVIDADSVYVRGNMFWLSQAIGIAGLIVNAMLLFSYGQRLRKNELAVLAVYIVLPVISMAIQIITYGFALLNLANTISTIIIFLCVHLDYVRKERELNQKILQQGMELASERATLAHTRVDLLRSQIQPHFIYNTLGTISELCLIDPPKASEVVIEFSKYLRGNFDELECNVPIRVSREIEHVKHYTAIENVRFPDMKFYYELHSLDFSVPALSIQPLVENAVKHGLMGRDSGGTVRISTYETIDAFYVQVRDNGVGFDTNVPFAKRDRIHLGIDNIRERVRIMCGGELSIESTPGRGTVSTVKIPKQRELAAEKELRIHDRSGAGR